LGVGIFLITPKKFQDPDPFPKEKKPGWCFPKGPQIFGGGKKVGGQFWTCRRNPFSQVFTRLKGEVKD
jgi:hypothetical protein